RKVVATNTRTAVSQCTKKLPTACPIKLVARTNGTGNSARSLGGQFGRSALRALPKALSRCRSGEIRTRRQLACRKCERCRVDKRLRMCPGHRGARRGEPRLRGGRVSQCTDAVRVRVAGAVESGFRCGLQRNGGIVLLQPGIDLVVGERHLAQRLVGALL